MPSGEKASGKDWIEGWEGLRVGLNTMEKRKKSLPLAQN
jgi:hypothetical protein